MISFSAGGRNLRNVDVAAFAPARIIIFVDNGHDEDTGDEASRVASLGRTQWTDAPRRRSWHVMRAARHRRCPLSWPAPTHAPPCMYPSFSSTTRQLATPASRQPRGGGRSTHSLAHFDTPTKIIIAYVYLYPDYNVHAV